MILVASDCHQKHWNICPHDAEYYEKNRDDPRLVKVVKALGRYVNGPYSNLIVVSIPDDVEWEISEYDGLEHVAEKHRKWYT